MSENESDFFQQMATKNKCKEDNDEKNGYKSKGV